MADQNTGAATQLRTRIQTLLDGGASKAAIREYLRGIHVACIWECFLEMAKVVATMEPNQARMLTQFVADIVQHAAQHEKEISNGA